MVRATDSVGSRPYLPCPAICPSTVTLGTQAGIDPPLFFPASGTRKAGGLHDHDPTAAWVTVCTGLQSSKLPVESRAVERPGPGGPLSCAVDHWHDSTWIQLRPHPRRRPLGGWDSGTVTTVVSNLNLVAGPDSNEQVMILKFEHHHHLMLASDLIHNQCQ